MKEKKAKVLYVDSSINDMKSFETAFNRTFNVVSVTTAHEALWNLARYEIPVLVIGEHLEDGAGIKLSEQVMAQHPDVVRIMITKQTSIQEMVDAVNKTHVFAYINEPWEAEEMQSLLNDGVSVFERRTVQKSKLVQLERTNQQLAFMLQESMVS